MTEPELSQIVRLIGKDGRQIGLVPFGRAVQLAKADYLVKVSDTVSPPVYRIVDSAEYLKHQNPN
jgi:translation initiation factor IF-3